MTRILVTGGAGFIGSSLVDAILHLGHEYHVTVFDNLSRGRINNISHWLDHPNFKFVRADMLDLPALQRVIDTCDTVFHLAANAVVPLLADDTKMDYEQNLVATYNLLESMKRSRYCKNLIYASTSAVYGEATIIPTSETYPMPKPISIYGATKLGCEAMISGYSQMFSISGVIVRLANIIGPLNHHGVIYDFITKLSSNRKRLHILGNGKQTKSYLYIDDCIEALLLLLGSVKKITFDVFNVGSDDTISVLELAQIMIQELGLGNVDVIFTNTYDGRGWKGDVREFCLDCSKLKALGWKAKRNSREAVVHTIKQLVAQRNFPIKGMFDSTRVE